MQYLVIITFSPYKNSLIKPCIDILNAIIKQGNSLKVFFYSDGVYNTINNMSSASDEFDIHSSLECLSQKCSFYMCETAAARRGIVSPYVSSFIEVSTLGELSVLLNNSDRVLYF